MAMNANTDQPDYRSPTYQSQEPRWKLVRDMREGLEAIRENASIYLPRFESETPKDWAARVRMTFYNNYYAQTLTDDVGLVFAEEPVLQKDVPAVIKQLLDDADGRGTKWNVFARDAFESGLDLGHGAIWTDLPAVPAEQRANLQVYEAGKNRPYWTFLAADDIVSHRTAVIGGLEVIVQFVRREDVAVNDGQFGSTSKCQYRVYRQEVITNAAGKGVRLGIMTWELWTEIPTPSGKKSKGYTMTDSGEIKGPKRLPIRPFYGGEKLGILNSKPKNISIAETSIEETQVGSDYAAVMHRCNVPTPYFTGLQLNETVNMSQGISLPLNGTAGYLEPRGTALGATRQRLEDIRAQLRRLGATTPASDQNAQARMTATEAAQIARQRNARLITAAQSFEDAMNGSLDDMAAFMPSVTTGGHVLLNREFAGSPADPVFIDQVGKAYDRGVVTIDEYRYALQHGELPDDTDETVVHKILEAVQNAKTEAEAKAAADQRAKLAAGGGDPNAGNGDPGIAA